MNHAATAAATAAQIRFVSVTCAAVKCSLICPIYCMCGYKYNLYIVCVDINR